jgi:hypothetical protein
LFHLRDGTMATSQTCCHLPGEMLNSAAECADRARIENGRTTSPQGSGNQIKQLFLKLYPIFKINQIKKLFLLPRFLFEVFSFCCLALAKSGPNQLPQF